MYIIFKANPINLFTTIFSSEKVAHDVIVNTTEQYISWPILIISLIITKWEFNSTCDASKQVD